ncbi:MAG TPA: 30S ribosomal protein S6 [Cyanobacteria bacterium UBA11149]|nr:30S ribosomal protein S6 [Cyanobacteria bacterium UBA11367]HBE56888.1 30S ribosomal protein S6 [Cyanobacteria bacterium UBA11366]HBR75309.1 30S ribosomal protein S6 [Cyanobacteria bacterium UBA11159]HBS67577.1 30S ribosomal protein S6 [Cyanobacteria bacterium UBA11153]HBW92131.1 30S ribosomal protein S6 [Cyanobacteria bacterium UBA11149]HCA93761.1 30S ribosomal protein S6 [Cyanobacteria bacterium UBA9226]
MSDSYELMYILRPDLSEEQVNVAIAKYRELLHTQLATDIEIQHRGKRRLAYMIGKHREGIYIQMNYKAPPTHVIPVEKAMRYSEDVIRYLTLKQELPAPKPEAVAAQS